MSGFSSVQRRKDRGLVLEAGFVPYMGGTEPGLPRNQVVTPQGSPVGALDDISMLGKAGELGEENKGTPIGDETNVVEEEIRKIKECLGTLEECSVSLDPMFNGAFGNEANRLSKIAVYLAKIVEKLEENLLEHTPE